VTGRSAAAGSTTTIPEPGTEALQVNDSDMSEAVRAWWLAESDRRDRDLAARWRAWQEGWQACEAAQDDAWEAGYAAAAADLKRAQHDKHRAAVQLAAWIDATEAIEQARWELRGDPRTRETFGQPHPGDYIPAGAA
jgi:hypothetical protein